MSEIGRFATFTLSTLDEYNDQIGWMNKWNEDNNWGLDSMEVRAGTLESVVAEELAFQYYTEENDPGGFYGEIDNDYMTFLQGLKLLLNESESYTSYLKKTGKEGS